MKDSEIEMFEIETVRGCNLRCIWCPIDHSLPIKYMDLNLFEKILSDISEVKGIKRIFLFGAGEPLLHPSFERTLQLCEKYVLHHKVPERFLFTNATLLSKEKSEFICDSPVINKLVFSIDGLGTAESYNFIRRGSDWRLVKENILNFIEIHDRKGYSRIDYYLRPVIPSSYDGLPFQPLEKEEILRNFRENFSPKIGVELVEAHLYDGKKSLPGTTISLRINDDCWRVHVGDFYITWEGKVMPCCHIIDSEEAVIGNVNEQSVKEIYFGEKYQHIRNILAARKRQELDICKDCTLCAFREIKPSWLVRVSKSALRMLPERYYTSLKKTYHFWMNKGQGE